MYNKILAMKVEYTKNKEVDDGLTYKTISKILIATDHIVKNRNCTGTA